MKGRLDEAMAAYRRAIALAPDYAEAYCNLGECLRHKEEFAEALAATKRGHDLGSRRRGWSYPSARWVRECQGLVGLDGREHAVLRGEAQPPGAAGKNRYARPRHYKKP